ncbi:MAG: copper resistance system multicopper oxidase [Candidatus Binataceae bacterium]
MRLISPGGRHPTESPGTTEKAPPGISRRRFVQGVASGAALAGIGLWRWPAAAIGSAFPTAVLKGDNFKLTVEDVPVNFTGYSSTATAVNGLVPGPLLRFREDDTVTIAVTNRLGETSSIHWHGLRVPAEMDGVPGLSFAGIAPGETFVYRFPVRQRGTYWYHAHSGFQEQTGLYGPLIIEPKGADPIAFDREHVVMLSDWTDQNPDVIFSNLKQQSNYYNYYQRTARTFIRDTQKNGLDATVADRLAWGRMNMAPTDILDVSGAAYTYLINGHPPAANWTPLFRPGERVRLRFINGSAMSIFDVRIPNLPMTVVQTDGNDVEPVTVDEFRISVAETYDVIVQPTAPAYTIFAQVEDRTGYARATLAQREGLSAPVPPMDPRPLRTMVDMGMGASTMKMEATSEMESMPGMQMGPDHHAHQAAAEPAPPMIPKPKELHRGPQIDNVAENPTTRLASPGVGLDNNGRRVLTYTDLRARYRGLDPRPPDREIELHLTGNMERFIWGFDGQKFSAAEPIRLKLGERVRIILINDTMMDHPIHLHGLWSELENGNGDLRPYKHTINVKGGERLSYLVSADVPGHWAYHCHLLFHMEAGMFRTVIVS